MTGSGPGPPRKRADFLALLDAHGIAHPSRMTLDEAADLCEHHGLVPRRPVSERRRLSNLLELAGVAFQKRAGVEHLRALAVENGLETTEFKDVEEITVIKRGLRRSLKCLSDDDYTKFTGFIEPMVVIVSKMMRRASLAMSYHVTRLLRSNPGAVVDLYSQKDTYWKDWMRIGTAGHFPAEPLSTEVRLEVVTPAGADGVHVALRYVRVDEVRRSYGTLESVLDRLYSEGTAQPKYFDQVLNYAAHQLQTIVTNNAWVPLFTRLRRLAKVQLSRWVSCGAVPARTLDADRILRAVRSADDDVDDGWPAVARSWVADVRARLCVDDGEYVSDRHGYENLKFHQVARFNLWMQERFRALGVRGIRIMPICRVRRAHVRLDAKTLMAIIGSMFPEHPAVEAAHGAARAYRAALAPVLTAHGGQDTSGDECGAPDRYFLPRAPETLTKKKCTAEQWEAYRQAVAQHKAAVAAVRELDWFRALDDQYKAYRGMMERVPETFFEAPKRGGWRFGASVVTDGVAISISYKRVVRKPIFSAKKKKARTKAASEDVAAVDDYDRHLPTTFDDTVVLGVDPGRSNLATVIVLHEDPKTGHLRRMKWSLSRGRYLDGSHSRRVEKLMAERRSGLASDFETIATEETTLNASRCDEVLEYARRVSRFSDRWWAVALDKTESAASFWAYRGKRTILDGFWSGVFRDVRRTFPRSRRIEVAYGEAGLTMSPTGRGEVAVPTTGMFRACGRIAKQCGATVTPTDEYNSTKMAWETGVKKEIVFVACQQADGGSGLRLGHTPGQKAPLVPAQHVAAIEAFVQRRRRRQRDRMGRPRSDPSRGGSSPQPLRFPEVRGLRFDPERRMYLDRDRTAAEAIARLRVCELRGWGRPTPFCRPRSRGPRDASTVDTERPAVVSGV